MKDSKADLVSVVSSITSKHIRRITTGLVIPVTDTTLRFAIESKAWAEFDDAITLLAERTLNHGHELLLEFHFCGSPESDAVYSLFPRFVMSGRLEVIKSAYVWTGSVSSPSLPSEAEQLNFG